MIDTNFIIRYTNALYTTPPEFAPRYDEFRDMLSSGQLLSKQWLIDQLVKADPVQQNKKFTIVGAWFGTLGLMIRKQFPTSLVTLLDIDPRCEKFITNLVAGDPYVRGITDDMFRYPCTDDIIINTSCEHIRDVAGWLRMLPKNRTVVLQSNNHFAGNDHVSCITSSDEFVKQTGLSNITFSGELRFPMYTRFMIIGQT